MIMVLLHVVWELNPILLGLRAIWHAAIFRALFLQDDASYNSHLVLDLVTPMHTRTWRWGDRVLLCLRSNESINSYCLVFAAIGGFFAAGIF